MTRDGDELPDALSGFRLFCLTFIFTFAGVMSNLAAFQFLTLYFDQHEVTQPSSDDESWQPRLVKLGASPRMPNL